MRTATRIFIWLVTSVGLLVARGAADETSWPKLRETFEKMRARDGAPSLAIAVAKGGQIVWEEGLGLADQERKVPATPHTPYSIASISKPITATGLMVLAGRDAVDLDRPANEYLGATKLTSHQGDAAGATLRQLANHTSGLPLHYHFFHEDDPPRPPSFDDSLRRYGQLLAPPGEEYQYANFGYGVLGEVVQRASRQSYAEFLRSEVFVPLGMKNTSVGGVGGAIPAAVRYLNGRPLSRYDDDHPGASAIFSSAHDLALFGMFQLRQGGVAAKTILSDQGLEEMQRGTAKVSGTRQYGIGWFIDDSEFGYRTISHTGGMAGVRCRLVLVPSERIAVAVLCNASTNLPLRVAREILAELIPEYGISMRKDGEHRPNPDFPPTSTPPELVGFWQGDVETYEGTRRLELWVHPDGDIKVRFAGQLLTLLNRAQFRDGLLSGRFAGTLETSDARRRPHQLQIRLRLRSETLNGAVSAVAVASDKAGIALSHWAELKRVDRDPLTMSWFNGHNLDGWRVIDDYDYANHGTVRVEQGELILGTGQLGTGIAWESPPRMNYELSLEAKRVDGSDFFCGLTFPVGTDYLTLIVGGWGGGVTGISNLDGSSAVENETTGYRDFQQNRWYSIRLRVTPNRVAAWLDGESLVDVSTENRKLSIWWEVYPCRPLGIATWKTTAALRNIRVKRVAGP